MAATSGFISQRRRSLLQAGQQHKAHSQKEGSPDAGRQIILFTRSTLGQN